MSDKLVLQALEIEQRLQTKLDRLLAIITLHGERDQLVGMKEGLQEAINIVKLYS